MPALPKELATGNVKGLIARGGFELNIDWKDGELEKLTVKSLRGNSCKIKYGDKIIDFKTKTGKEYSFNGALK